MSEKKSLGHLAVVSMVILAKASKLLKAAKFLKVAKPMITFITMSISAVAYAFWLGPWFSIGLIAMLFIHEMGHVAAMRMRGFEASTPVFIPFLGAAIFAPKMDDRDDEAFVGICGPVLGSIAALLVFGIWAMVPNKESNLAILLLTVSYVGIFLNLFNMIPIRPLDGGRVTQAVGEWFKYIGVLTLGAFSIVFREPVILLIWLLVLPELTILPAKLRALLAVVLYVSMVTLMGLGYSSQPFWVDVFDCIMGALMVILTIVMAIGAVELPDEDGLRPELSGALKWQWAGRYLMLAALLICVIVWQAQYLPTPPQ